MKIIKSVCIVLLLGNIAIFGVQPECNEGLTCALDSGESWLADKQISGRPTITVWVHGSKLPPQSILYFFLYRKEGLHRAVCYDWKYRMREMAQDLSDADPINYPLEHIYFFGWSGFLNFQAREEAARDLYRDLQALRALYTKRYGQTPSLRVITHSHGGNVALNLARVTGDLTVDELIILACPVQDETSYLISHPMFKKIYALYSTGDMFQVIDPQGLYKNNCYGTHNFFSQRRFPCELPHLCQIKAKNREASFAHIDFLRQPFLSHLPQIIKKCSEHVGNIGNEAWVSVQKIKRRCPRRHWRYGLVFEPCAE